MRIKTSSVSTPGDSLKIYSKTFREVLSMGIVSSFTDFGKTGKVGHGN